MKIKYLTLTAILLTAASFAFSQGRPEPVESLAARVSQAFKTKKLSTLDGGNFYSGRVKFEVEHSLEGSKETKSFSSMKSAGEWLFRSRRQIGVNAGNLQRCSNGTCSFTVNGMLHNNLYLKKVTYGYSNGKPVIKTVYFIDGD
ncbi:MAG: hypothetical protein QM785_16010 [Pyrinomonadaceae bacterium]